MERNGRVGVSDSKAARGEAWSGKTKLTELELRISIEAGWMTMEEVDAGWPEVLWGN